MHVLTAMDDNMNDSVVFKQWVSADRSTLEAVTKPIDEFVELYFRMFCLSYERVWPSFLTWTASLCSSLIVLSKRPQCGQGNDLIFSIKG